MEAKEREKKAILSTFEAEERDNEASKAKREAAKREKEASEAKREADMREEEASKDIKKAEKREKEASVAIREAEQRVRRQMKISGKFKFKKNTNLNTMRDEGSQGSRATSFFIFAFIFLIVGLCFSC